MKERRGGGGIAGLVFHADPLDPLPPPGTVTFGMKELNVGSTVVRSPSVHR